MERGKLRDGGIDKTGGEGRKGNTKVKGGDKRDKKVRGEEGEERERERRGRGRREGRKKGGSCQHKNRDAKKINTFGIVVVIFNDDPAATSKGEMPSNTRAIAVGGVRSMARGSK